MRQLTKRANPWETRNVSAVKSGLLHKESLACDDGKDLTEKQMFSEDYESSEFGYSWTKANLIVVGFE